MQLTELKALLGCVGETRFVMGCISQLQDGRYFLEDLSDALPIDLSEAQTTSGFFTGESPAMGYIFSREILTTCALRGRNHPLSLHCRRSKPG